MMKVEGFHKRLQQEFFFQFSINFKMHHNLFGSGKEAFDMVRRTFLGCPRRGPGRRRH
jgi:hypothetical protein